MAMPVSDIAIFSLASLGLGGFCALQWSQRRFTLLRLRAVMGRTDADEGDALALLARLGSCLPGASDDSLKSLLTDAGFFQAAAVPVLVACRLAVTMAVFFGVLLRSHPVGAVALMPAAFLAFFTSRLFVILLKLKAEARHRGIRRELPPLVDILLMVLNSGVSIDQCMRYVTTVLEQAAPLTGIVFRRYVADIDSGMPYETAFERLGQRLGIEEGYDLTSMIKQALLQGGEIATALERFGAELADKRIAAAREQIGRRAVALTLVMLVFFMPVLLIILGGPAVSNITDTLKTVQQQIHDRKAKR